MIRTEYIALTTAAERLDDTVTNLLNAAGGDEFRIFGLLDQAVKAVLVPKDTEPEVLESFTGEVHMPAIDFVPLTKSHVSRLLTSGHTGNISVLSEPNDQGLCWMRPGGEYNFETDIALSVKAENTYMKTVDFELLEKETEESCRRKAHKSVSDLRHPNVSRKLSLLNQASYLFWKDFTLDDLTTTTKNSTVVAWLIDKEFSPSLAKHAAAIIRPEGAPSGRVKDD